MILASAFTAVTAALLTGPGTYFDEDFADITAATGHAYVVQEYQYRLHLFFLSQRLFFLLRFLTNIHLLPRLGGVNLPKKITQTRISSWSLRKTAITKRCRQSWAKEAIPLPSQRSFRKIKLQVHFPFRR